MMSALNISGWSSPIWSTMTPPTLMPAAMASSAPSCRHTATTSSLISAMDVGVSGLSE